MDKEFNLLDKPWIRVLCKDCTIKEVSLRELFTNADSYLDLAGETKTQNFAVLRFLLAILSTVFSRTEPDGNPSPIDSVDTALDRWKWLWDLGRFPQNPILQYLEKYKDRFYLFHPQYPFCQSPRAIIGTKYSAGKLNGAISESSNKHKLFSSRACEEKGSLSYGESARWLLCLNCYDDCSVKEKEKGPDKTKSPGVGWLGKIGPISAVGNNLFETLMLNLCFLKDGEELWGEPKPIWELDSPPTGQRQETSIPDNPAELYTFPSRHFLLIEENGRVTGYHALGGYYFNKENAFQEQMTAWYFNKTKKAYMPMQLNRCRQMWRDFPNLLAKAERQKIPGIIKWLTKLQDEGILDEEYAINLRTAGVEYDEKNQKIEDEFGDSLSFTSGLIAEKGEIWSELVTEEVRKCNLRCRAIKELEENIEYASAGCKKESAGNPRKQKDTPAEAEYYFRLDVPFRKWLRTLDPLQTAEERDKKRKEWDEIATKITREYGRELVFNAGRRASIGRNVTIEVKGKQITKHYSAPEAINLFEWNLNQISKGE